MFKKFRTIKEIDFGNKNDKSLMNNNEVWKLIKDGKGKGQSRKLSYFEKINN